MAFLLLRTPRLTTDVGMLWAVDPLACLVLACLAYSCIYGNALHKQTNAVFTFGGNCPRAFVTVLHKCSKIPSAYHGVPRTHMHNLFAAGELEADILVEAWGSVSVIGAGNVVGLGRRCTSRLNPGKPSPE